MTVPLTFTPVVRVMLIVGKQCLDVELPIGIPVRDVVNSLESLIQQGKDTDSYTPDQHLVLGEVGRAPFADEATLEALAIQDGSILVLQNKSYPLPYTPSIVEDIAQLASTTSVLEPIRTPILLTRTFLTQFLLICTFLQINFFIIRTYTPSAINFATFSYGASIVINLLLMMTTLLLRQVYTRGKISNTFAGTGLLTALIAIPQIHSSEYFHPSLLATCIYIFFWSWIFFNVLPTGRSLWAGITISALSILPLITVECFIPLSQTIIGCSLIVVAFILHIGASSFGQIITGLPHKRVPEQNAHTTMIFTKNLLRKLREHIRATKQAILGIIAASIVLQSCGYVFLPLENPNIIYIIITVMATLLRMNIWISPNIKRVISWVIPITFSIVITKLLVLHDIFRAYILCVALGITPLMGIAFFAGLPFLTFSSSYPIVFRYGMRLLSCALDVTLIVGALYLTGVFSWALHR